MIWDEARAWQKRAFALTSCLYLCLLSACVHHPVVLRSEPIVSEDIDPLLSIFPFASGTNIAMVEMQSGPHASLSLVQIRDREQPHRHTRYDLVVMLVRGKGTLHLDD